MSLGSDMQLETLLCLWLGPKRPNPKERKLEDVATNPLLASSLSEALAEPRFTYTTGRYVTSMSIQKEFDVRPPPSHLLSVAVGKQNSATRCANLQCSKELLYLREGSLRLLELESDSDDQSPQDDGAFAMKPLRSKFFWLCGECSKTHIVKQWTTSGLLLVLRNQKSAGTGPNLITPAAVATAQRLPVSLTVLPIPPTGHPRPPSLASRRNFLGPKTG
jgi:hypothetical protein